MSKRNAVAERPAPIHRLNRAPRRRSDTPIALDMFSGCGGSSQGVEAAGFEVWFAANHWEYAVELHEDNHPKAEHFIADLVDTNRKDYYRASDLPRADLLWASPSCTNHSRANSERAYATDEPVTEFDDPDYDERVTKSEQSRATAVCVLQYARKHRPLAIVVENVPEFAQWGVQRGKAKRGDGSTYRWWLSEFDKLGYNHRALFLNAMFFPPCPQSRDRMFVVFVDKSIPMPDFDHRPVARCDFCGDVEAVQTFKRPTEAWCGLKEWGCYGRQYIYSCPHCAREVKPITTPAYTAIDWSNLGERIGDKALKASTLARIERGLEKFKDWPAFAVPAKANRGVEHHVGSPFTTQTTQQEKMLVRGGMVVAAGNTYVHNAKSTCRTRDLNDPMWTQHTTAAYGFFHTTPWVTEVRGGGSVVSGHHAVTDKLPVVTANGNHHLLVCPPVLFAKQNGGPNDTAWHRVDEPFNGFTSVDSTCIVGHPFVYEYQSAARSVSGPMATQTTKDVKALIVPPLGDVELEDLYYRMLQPHEIKLGMAFRPDYKMKGTARNQVKALGNAVVPTQSEWICSRLRPIFA